ncbi:MAG: NYN domain-containing protein [Rickettsiales bacterium]|nr:NYN domain-containing protein [Rickettsiales bacterium]
MQKVSIFIDGYNLYHSVDYLKKDYLKWVNPKVFCKFFINNKSEEIKRVKFFTAFPNHKNQDVQERYKAFTGALKHYDIEVIEGNFKRKLVKFNHNNQEFTRLTHEEKESDVNLALAILEDAYEKISDKILVVTNDSDIAPAIKMALQKNNQLKINIVTPPISDTKTISKSLYYASGNINKNRKGQVYHKQAIIRDFMLEQAIMPEEIITKNGNKIIIPNEYKKPKV